MSSPYAMTPGYVARRMRSSGCWRCRDAVVACNEATLVHDPVDADGRLLRGFQL
jgi:hypothetical protein